MATLVLIPPAASSGGSGSGVSAGPSGAVQYSDGAAGFLGEAAFSYDQTANALTADNLSITGATTLAGSAVTAAGIALIDDASASAQRTTLGLGTIATQAASSVTISGGAITGITDLAVADGGTGASTAANARTNLGLAAVAASGAAADVSGLATVATTGSAADLTGTLAAARLPALTGDVTSSAGSAATTVANIPVAVTVAGRLIVTAVAAPSTPSAGTAAEYVDSTSKNICVKDDAGVIKHGVQTKAAVTSNFVTAISDAGVVSVAQPAASDVTGLAATATSTDAANLSGSLSAARMPALTGDVTTSAGAVATTITGHAVTNAMLRQSTALTVVGRSANSTGDVADISAGTDGDVLRRSGTTLGFGTLAAAAMPAFTGDATSSAGATALTIASAAVSLAKMANLAAQTIIGRATGASTGVPTALTPAQVMAVIFGASTLISIGSSGSTKTIDWTAGMMQTITMSANCTFTFTAPTFVTRLELTIVQDSTPRTITWPAAVQWIGGAAPTLSAGSGAVDIITFSYNGTNYRGVANTGANGAFA